MIIVDEALKRRAARGEEIRVAMVGAGFMGQALANQIVNSVPGMRLVAISNRHIKRAQDAWAYAGVAETDTADTTAQIDAAVGRGRPVSTEDAHALVQADCVDCVVDVTGAVEFGAHLTLAAIAAGKPVVTMNAELDGTVGPVLAHRARQAGVVLTGADGDQPGVQMNLIRFVQGLGATPLVAGNIKGLQDPYRTPETQRGFAERWGQDPAMVTSFADGTKISFEQALVANATGMQVARRGMIGINHGGHVDDLVDMYDIERLNELGGVVEYVVGASPGPGVYILAEARDAAQALYLDYGKLGKGPLYSFYVPYHLTVFEVALSVARVVLFGDTVVAPAGGPVVDVVTTAKTNCRAGDVLDGLGFYMTYGQCENYGAARDENLLPMGLAEGCRLIRDVAKDQVLTYDDVELPTGTRVHPLRAEQDQLFPAGSSAVLG